MSISGGKVNGRDWITDLLLARKSNHSAVLLVQTYDPLRISQFLRAVVEDFEVKKLRPEEGDYTRYYYDIQRGRLFSLSISLDVDSGAHVLSKMPVVPSSSTQPILGVAGHPLLDYLDQELTSKPTILVISYVTRCNQANLLSNYVEAWCLDTKLYREYSTVVVFTSDISLFPEAVRRIAFCYSVVPSTSEERRVIIEKCLKGLSYEASEEDISRLVSASAGLTLHETEVGVLRSFYFHRKIIPEAFTQLKIELLEKMGLEFIEPKYGFEAFGGYSYLKEYIRSRIILPITNPDLAKHYGVPVPRGIILYGYYGCGKSFLAECMAKEIGLTMVRIRPSTFLSRYVGETEARIRRITQILDAMAPNIVFCDEIDQLAMARDRITMGDSGVFRRLISGLLEWLGKRDRKSFLIGATNYVEALDRAFIRHGRIDEVILVLPPDFEARREILRIHTSVIRKIPVGKVDLDEIAKMTALWTGAELEHLCIEASKTAMREGSKTVEMEHFMEVMEGVSINRTERMNEISRMIREMQRLTVVNRRLLRESIKAFTESERRVESIESERIATLLDQLE